MNTNRGRSSSNYIRENSLWSVALLCVAVVCLTVLLRSPLGAAVPGRMMPPPAHGPILDSHRT